MFPHCVGINRRAEEDESHVAQFAIAGLAATAFLAATALTPTGAAAGGRGGGAGNYPHYGLELARLY